jgi:hypothetical protein
MEDQSAPTPEDITSKLGGNITGTWFLNARSEGQPGHFLQEKIEMDVRRWRSTKSPTHGLLSFSILLALDQ